MSTRSSTACLFSSLSGRCAAMVSARRPASSMLAMEVRISGGIFLLSLTYWSNCCVTARRRASISLGLCVSASGATGTTEPTKWVSSSMTCLTSARCWPSTSTLTVPSGSLSICKMVDTQPTSNMSAAVGSSLEAVFWATSMMRRSPSMASSSALMLLARPTNSGITMWGNTTTSRSGSSARSRGVEGKGVCPDMGILGLSAEDGPHTGVFQPCGPKGFRDAGTCAARPLQAAAHQAFLAASR